MKNTPKNIFNSYAREYQDKFMGFELYNDSFDLFCDQVDIKNASVLEIGCGPGNITKYLLNKRKDFRITGIDIAPNMIALAKENNPSATFKAMDSKNILQFKTKFDAILCGFLLPYLDKEKVLKLIEDISELINSNGILYISTMEDKYAKSKYLASSTNKNTRLFTYYHEASYLTEFLQENEFKIIKTQRKEYPEPKDDSNDLIIIAKKICNI